MLRNFSPVLLFVICMAVLTAVSLAESRSVINFDLARFAHPMPTPPDEIGNAGYGGYKGIAIGATTDDVRSKLGSPKDKSDTQDFFVFSDKESAQVYYDAGHKVTLISVNYMGNPSSIPSPKQVFGTEVEAKPDGSIFKMVRYPKAGYWISYNRTAGEDPIIIITVQKIQS